MTVCRFSYIERTSLSTNEKERLNQIHKSIFDKAKESGFFRSFMGKVYTVKNKYPEALKTLADINKEYPVNVARLESQRKDQYYLTVNVLPLAREGQQGEIFSQLIPEEGEIIQSVASEETIKKIKEIAEKAGISIQDLAEYAKKTGLDTKGVNGVADLLHKIVGIAEGKEGISITEEVVHIITAIVEQTNPELITSLISKIGRYKIYNETLELYKNNKFYQTADGKPDIRKIKKEAVDKLISEIIINRLQGTVENPELLEEETVSFVERIWRAILDYLKGLFNSHNISYDELAGRIIAGEIQGEAGEGIYLNVEPNSIVDTIYKKFIDMDSRLQLIDATNTKKRHYTFDGIEVEKSVTEKVKEGQNLPDFTPEQIEEFNQKKLWGLEGHAYIANYIETNLINKDGYRLPTPKNDRIETKLNIKITSQLEAFAKELINSYAPGTRFLVEKKVINEKVKGKIASTMDFVAIEPTKDGKDVKIDILDWKFANINTDYQEDIPWYKTKEWNEQMTEYVKIANNYGVKPTQIRRARMIPFQANYKNVGKRKTPFDKQGIDLRLVSLEIGNLDPTKENKMYLLPVPLQTERTDEEEIDKLIRSLREYYRKIYKTIVSPEEQHIKNQKMNELSSAIRSLHIKKDFTPLISVGERFLRDAAEVFGEFENIDYNKLTQEEINDKLAQLLTIRNSAAKFASLDEVFVSHIPKDKLTDLDKKILAKLDIISASTRRMLDKIEELEKEYVIYYAVKTGITTEENKESVLNPEKEIGGFAKTFLEGSKLPAKLIKLASNLILKAKSEVALTTNKLIDRFTPLLLDLEKEAKSKGKSAFSLIGQVHNGKLQLINKIDRTFLSEVYKNRKDKNADFFIKNMDMKKYKTLAKEAMDRRIAEENKKHFSDDEMIDEVRRKAAINKIKLSLDIESDSFNGFEDYDFKRIFWESLKEESHQISKEYKEMTPAARAVWQFFTDLNIKAKQMGYLGHQQGFTFFPLMEATIIEKLSKTDNLLSESGNIIKDLYTVRPEEEYVYSKIDEETGKVRKEIPKLFTRTNKAVNQLSTDLNKVGVLYMKALTEFESSKSIENTLLILHNVEKNKGKIVVDNAGNPIFEGGTLKTVEENEKNASILQTIIDDGIYGLRENLNSIGNVGLSSVTGAFKKDDKEREESELSIKKGLNNANKLVQSLAVGLKLLVTIPNYIGFNMHAAINSGRLITFKEFEKNNLKVVTGRLSLTEKALMDKIIPLNEDISTELRRKVAKKEGFIDYLSTWSFHDIMMVSNSFPDRLLQYANALSFFENTMILDGKLVNIRQHVTQEIRKERESKSESERRIIEKSFEERVNKYKEKSLTRIAEIKDDELILPGVSNEELAKFRVKVIEYSRNMSGQMNNDNKADFRRDTILKSFMMFKGWIPKQFSSRTLDIHKNLELDQWEYGRTRAFLKTIQHIGLRNITNLRDVYLGTDKGLDILKSMYDNKKEAYYLKTGQQLDITEEEFYDLIRSEIHNQFKELSLLVGLIGLFVAIKLAEPPEDEEDRYTLNRYKFIAKASNKIMDELWFYYNPLSFESMTRGSVLPALGILTKVQKFLNASAKLGYGYVVDDEDMIEKAHPTKYFLNLIPVAHQFQNELLPIFDPELAKEMGIRVTEEARQK